MACDTKLFPTAQLAATELQILLIFMLELHFRVGGIATKNCADPNSESKVPAAPPSGASTPQRRGKELHSLFPMATVANSFVNAPAA